MRNATHHPEAHRPGVPLETLVRDVLRHRYPELEPAVAERIVAVTVDSVAGTPDAERSATAVRAALVRAGRETGRLPVRSREELDWRLDGIDTTLVIAGPRPPVPDTYEEWEPWEPEPAHGGSWARAVTVVAAVLIAMEALAVVEPGTQLEPDSAPQQAALLPPPSERSAGTEPEAPAALVRRVRAKLREPLRRRPARRSRPRAAAAAAGGSSSSTPAAAAPAASSAPAPAAQSAPAARPAPAPAPAPAQQAPAPAPKPAPAATPKPAAESAPQRFDDSG